MSDAILLLTFGIELGLAAGYALAEVRRWFYDCRRMGLGFCAALRGQEHGQRGATP